MWSQCLGIKQVKHYWYQVPINFWTGANWHWNTINKKQRQLNLCKNSFLWKLRCPLDALIYLSKYQVWQSLEVFHHSVTCHYIVRHCHGPFQEVMTYHFCIIMNKLLPILANYQVPTDFFKYSQKLPFAYARSDKNQNMAQNCRWDELR